MRVFFQGLSAVALLGVACRSTPALHGETEAVHARITLFAATGGVKPGEVFDAGILVRPDPGWHLYWLNPGDSGLAPRVSGASLLRMDWPLPERLVAGDLANFGYAGEVVFPLRLRAGPDAEGTLLRLHLDYLVCREECVPGSVDLELDLAHEGRVDGVLLGKLARARARVPRETGNYRVEALERSGGLLKVRIAGEGVSLAGGLDVFPENGERFSSRAVEAQVLESGLLELRLALEPNAPPAGPLGRIHVRLGEEIFLLDLDALRGR